MFNNTTTKTLAASLLLALVALLGACQPLQPTTEKEVALELVTHVVAGMAEQDVFVTNGNSADEVFRITGDEVEQYLDAPAYAAAEMIEHDLFGLGENPLGPYPKGLEMGFSMGEWLSGSGSGRYTIRGQEAEIDLTFKNLVPNSHYTLWCATVNTPPYVSIIDEPCGAADGSENSFFTDDDGNAAIRLTLAPLAETTDTALKVIAAAYHSDGKSYGALPGAFGLVSHVQLAAVIPAPDSEAWRPMNGQASASR